MSRISCCLISLLCAVPLAGADVAARVKAEDDIREAVFRYQFNRNGSALQEKARVYFLSVGENGRDPGDDFMKRFAVPKPLVTTVKKVSQSKVEGFSVKDKETGELRGLIFRATTIKWKSDTEVEVEGGYYEAPRSSSGNTYHLKFEDGKWVITRDVMNWIS